MRPPRMREGVTSVQPMSAEAPPREMPLSARPGLASSGLSPPPAPPPPPNIPARALGGMSSTEPLTLTLITVRRSPEPEPEPEAELPLVARVEAIAVEAPELDAAASSSPLTSIGASDVTCSTWKPNMYSSIESSKLVASDRRPFSAEVFLSSWTHIRYRECTVKARK